MSFLDVLEKFKLLQNSPVARPSPLDRPGLSHSTKNNSICQAWSAASLRYIDLAETGRIWPLDHQSRTSSLTGKGSEKLGAKTSRNWLSLPY